MKLHAKASSAATIDGFGTRRSLHLGALAGAVVALLALSLALAASPAQALYKEAPESPLMTDAAIEFIVAGSGVAVDSGTGDIFAAYWMNSAFTNGGIDKFNADGSDGTPATIGADDFFGVAVDPVTHNVYASNRGSESPPEPTQITTFDPDDGSIVGTPFTIDPDPSTQPAAAPQLSTDAAGNVYYPNQTDHTVEKFSPTGTLLQTFDDGAELERAYHAAVDAGGNVYVANSVGADKEEQTVAVDATGGTFTLTFDGETTASIPANASFQEVTDALEALSNIEEGEVNTQIFLGSYRITFSGQYEFVNVPQMTADGTNLTGGAQTVTVKTPLQGGPIGGRIVKYDSGGNLVDPEFIGFAGGAISSVDIDRTTGEIYLIAQGDNTPAKVRKYDSSGTQVDEFEVSGSTMRLAVNSSSGKVYVSMVTNEVKVFAPVVGPTITTTPAANVTSTSATLGGTVNPNGENVSACQILYGKTTTYDKAAPCSPSPGAGSSPVAVSANITGLSPDTTYHFAVRATNAGGTITSDDEEFQTLVPAPTVTTTAATSVTETTATLAGTVNPNGQSVTSCEIQYGPTTAYGQDAPCSPSPGAGASPVAVSAKVSGLSPGTSYHFRVVATSAGGTTNGADQAFTTQATPSPTPPAPPAPAPAPAPAPPVTPPPATNPAAYKACVKKAVKAFKKAKAKAKTKAAKKAAVKKKAKAIKKCRARFL